MSLIDDDPTHHLHHENEEDQQQPHDYKQIQAEAQARLAARLQRAKTSNEKSRRFSPAHGRTYIDVDTNKDEGRRSTLVDDTPAVADWNWSFLAVGIPFFGLGFPIHMLIGSGTSVRDEESAPKQEKITNTTDWVKSIFEPFNICKVIITAILFIVAIFIFVYFLYAIWLLIYNLAYLGEINPVVFTSVEHIFRLLPIIYPLIYFWFYGYGTKNLIYSFNAIFISFSKAFNNTWKNQNKDSHEGTDPPDTNLPPTSFWYKLTKFYVFILLLHVLELYLTITMTDEFAGEDFFYHLLQSTVWVGYALEIMNSLVLPVYCMFCWVLQSELELLVGYLNILVYYRSQPNFTSFNEIKYLYKKIARQIMGVNNVFSIYMSWLFFTVWGFASMKMSEASVNFFKYTMTSPVPPAIPSFLGGSAVSSMAMVSGSLLPPATAKLMAEEAAILMRQTLAMALVSIMQILLIVYTAYQAIYVNQAARSLHVIINDFVTYDLSTEMSTELYQAYRLLKFFLHSTMERYEEPALLRISILNYAPYFGYRLHHYTLKS